MCNTQGHSKHFRSGLAMGRGQTVHPCISRNITSHVTSLLLTVVWRFVAQAKCSFVLPRRRKSVALKLRLAWPDLLLS